ncbi:MAG: hypothetical protein WC208_07310 [Gallionella sp.]|jgi:hypothetical protein
MKIVGAVILSAGLIFAGISTDVQSETASLKAAVGIPFSIRINDDKNCSTIKPYDQISLLINGMETGLHPLGCDPATKELAFAIKKGDITPSPSTNTAWQVILGSPWDTVKSNFQRELRYTVSQPDESPDAQTLSSGKLSLLIANLGFGLLGAGLGAALWITLVYLGYNSGMLRDDGNQGYTLKQRTYSLGRVQMAWWFGIVMSAYIFLWAMTREIPALGSQALLLMGISGVTGLTSVGLNAGMQKQLPVSSGKFFEDLLTDAYGITLHRFQMLAMTAILGVMFVIHVVTTLTMPEFDGTLLALMGIAGGTYVGFKIPETQVNKSNPAVADATAATTEEHKAGYTPEPEPKSGN